MSDWIVPLSKPRPDIERFLAAMSGRKVPDKAPLVEYLIDNAVMRPILENMMGRKWVDTSAQTEHMGGQMDFSEAHLEIINAWLDNQIAFWYHLGYDFVRVEVSLPLPATALVVSDTAAGNEDHNRAWMDDLIDSVGIDAKHSFQDGVSPSGPAIPSPATSRSKTI